ncbi:hypothetical protein IFR05_008286 [Cadophora sp. M221]|nr:hypothetical protein IFR05_008286 [Cadophora sp. M221]
MWLIDATTIRLHFVEDPSTYEYAILSHTWEGGEVTFQDIANLEEATKKPGFAKIQKTCNLALERGITYAWVDTCCIDKTSSAELTEAINSMFQWYKLSAVCFAYLSDLPNCELRHNSSVLGACRWFTRGWTLQELIASKSIEFYDKQWNMKGTKLSLSTVLSRLTGVDEEIIRDSELVSTASVAKRMSWAASRQTTRVEDMSYCLFGIFDVHLPLIYGEGWKAFIRLQEAIILESSDLSIFAWKADFADQAIRGVLAFSPSEFRQAGDIQGLDDPLIIAPDFVITNKGVKIETFLRQRDGEYYMTLQCMDSKVRARDENQKVLAIRLLKTAHGYVRHRPTDLTIVSQAQKSTAKFLRTPSPEIKITSICIPKSISLAESRILHDRLVHGFSLKINALASYHHPTVTAQPQHLWDEGTYAFITECNEKFAGAVKLIVHPGGGFQFTRESITVFIFLGLASNIERTLQPWAGIYQDSPGLGLLYEDSNKKKVIVGPNFSTLPEMREALSPSATNNMSLPQTLTPVLEGRGGVKLPHVQLALTLSTDYHSPYARYQLIVSIRGE